MPSKDIGPILDGWPYEDGQLNVRKIRGADGRVKIQMRLDLGVLQMEAEGRPDGQAPFGCESLLAHHAKRIREYASRNGTELGYELSEEECRELRHEAAMYYQRYLALFALEDFEGVERDTVRNLEVLDLCRRFGGNDNDRYILEQYRPYILMMNARAKALRSLRQNEPRRALEQTEEGLRLIKTSFVDADEADAYPRSPEARVLKKLRRRIKKQLPPDPIARLRKQLRRALADERYEDAARLRDELSALGVELGTKPST